LTAGRKKRAKETAAFKAPERNQVALLAIGGVLLLAVGLVAQPALCSNFIVFVSGPCSLVFQVIWGARHIACTPRLMGLTTRFRQSSFWGASCRSGPESFFGDYSAALVGVYVRIKHSLWVFLVTRRMPCHVPKIVKGSVNATFWFYNSGYVSRRHPLHPRLGGPVGGRKAQSVAALVRDRGHGLAVVAT